MVDTHAYPGRGLAAVDCEDGSDCGEAVDVVGSVEGVEADDEAALPLALHLHHVVHLLRHQQARRPRAPEEKRRTVQASAVPIPKNQEL